MRGADVPARSRTNVLCGCESSRGPACVLVRCVLYPWASGSACRVDIEGGAVLGSLFLAKILPCASYKRPWAARSGSRLRLAGPTRHQGQHLGARHNTISSAAAANEMLLVNVYLEFRGDHTSTSNAS